MAAYAALVSLMQIIDEIKTHHSPPISINKKQVECLSEKVNSLCGFLEGYRSPFDYSDEADPLEMRIADAAYFAEDVIESHIMENILLRRSKEAKISRFYSWFRSPKDVSSSVDDEQTSLYQDLQQVIEEMDLAERVAMKIDTEKEMVHDLPQTNVSASGQNVSMVCSDDLLTEIKEKLVRGWSELKVIPIVGMGGIGKTTLARTVFSEPLIKQHFAICVWVAISQRFNTKDILCEVLSQATRSKKEEPSEKPRAKVSEKTRAKAKASEKPNVTLSEMSEDELGKELYEYLFGKMFLVVMDDLWSDDAWNKVQHYFPDNDNGSRILVTTRQSQLVFQSDSDYSLKMKFLDETKSWDLFSKTVFGEGSCPSNLERIGKKIVNSCRGLPLSIVVVGGLLKKMKHTPKCWEATRRNLTSEVNLDNDQHCLRLLKMSYNHLSVHLKPCFLYMGVFEEDSAIHVSTLIKQWVSEGLIKPVNGESLETVAKGIFKDLVDRNLILTDKLGCTGNIKYCKIHDLLRDLCLRESQKYGLYHVIEKVGNMGPRSINGQRRVVIPKRTSKLKVLDALSSMSHARSIIFSDIRKYGDIPRCRNLGLLRTLSVSTISPHGSSLNAVVFRSFNLRHLAITAGKMSSFFSSVNLIWNLHTLIVSYPSKCNAPVGIWKMPQFRHIEFRGGSLCLPNPPSDGRGDAVIMENLQILKGVQNLKCLPEVVKRIPNVKKLRLRYDDYEAIEHDNYFFLGNVKWLCKLESLDVSCDYGFRVASLRKLTLPNSLKSLSLAMNRFFYWEDMLENIGSLPFLQKLKLRDGYFWTKKWVIAEGQFPKLQYLSLDYCTGLEQWKTQGESILPSLEHLFIRKLDELKAIPCKIGDIPTLTNVELLWCSASAVESAKEIVNEQVDSRGFPLPFHVKVTLSTKDEDHALESLVGDFFEVKRL